MMYALDPPDSSPELRGEAIRSLAEVPVEYLSDLLLEVGNTDNEGVLVGLADLAVAMPPSPEVSQLVAELLNSAPRGELYEFLVTSLVASRRQDLIDIVLA